MKAILEIPDSLYLQASAKARSFGQNVGDFVVTVLQRELGTLGNEAAKPARACDLAYVQSDNGFLVFTRPSGLPPVTDSFINILREEEGV